MTCSALNRIKTFGEWLYGVLRIGKIKSFISSSDEIMGIQATLVNNVDPGPWSLVTLTLVTLVKKRHRHYYKIKLLPGHSRLDLKCHAYYFNKSYSK